MLVSIKKGDVLHRHKDRYSCEISTTVNLGGDSPWIQSISKMIRQKR